MAPKIVLFTVMAMIGFMVICLVVAGIVIDGTTMGIPHLIRGELVEISPLDGVIEGEKGKAKTTTMVVVNNSWQSIRITGAETACSCLQFPDLPIDVPLRSRSEFSVRSRLPANDDKMILRVLFYVDGNRRKRVATTIMLVSASPHGDHDTSL